MPETVFEKFGQRKKTIERLGARGELHQEIDVAVRPGIAPEDGSEQGKPSDTKRTDLWFGSRENFYRFFPGN